MMAVAVAGSRGGAPDSRFVVCADGSLSSRRIFPFLKQLLPAIRGPIDLVCARKPEPDARELARAEHCLHLANDWLTRCGKAVKVSQPRGPKRYKVILEAAGREAVIVMGESHMHDVRRRTLGTLPDESHAAHRCKLPHGQTAHRPGPGDVRGAVCVRVRLIVPSSSESN